MKHRPTWWHRLFPRPERLPTYFQLVWMQAKANGATNYQDLLPVNRLELPKNTWLQNKLNQSKVEDVSDA